MDVSLHLVRYLCPTIKDFVIRCELRVGEAVETFQSPRSEAAAPGRRPTNLACAARFSLPGAAPSAATLQVCVDRVDPVTGTQTEVARGIETISAEMLAKYELVLVRVTVAGPVAGRSLPLGRFDFEVQSEENTVEIRDGPGGSPLPPSPTAKLSVESPPARGVSPSATLKPTQSAAVLSPLPLLAIDYGPPDCEFRIVAHCAVGVPPPGAREVVAFHEATPHQVVRTPARAASTSPVWHAAMTVPFSSKAPETCVVVLQLVGSSGSVLAEFRLPPARLASHREYCLELVRDSLHLYITVMATHPMPAEASLLAVQIGAPSSPGPADALIAVASVVYDGGRGLLSSKDGPSRMLWTVAASPTGDVQLPRLPETSTQSAALQPGATWFDPGIWLLDALALFQPQTAIVIELYAWATQDATASASHAWRPARTAALATAIVPLTPETRSRMLPGGQTTLTGVPLSGPGYKGSLSVKLSLYGTLPSAPSTPGDPLAELPSDFTLLAARDTSVLGVDANLFANIHSPPREPQPPAVPPAPVPPARPAIVDELAAIVDRLRKQAHACAQDILTLRKESASLQEAKAKMARIAAQNAAAQAVTVDTAALEAQAQEALARTYIDAMERVANDRERYTEYLSRVQALQNKMISQNNQRGTLLQLERAHSTSLARLQRLQEHVGMAAKLRSACAQQEQVIARLEELVCSNRGTQLDRSTLHGSPACAALVRQVRELRARWADDVRGRGTGDPLRAYLQEHGGPAVDEAAMARERATLAGLVQRNAELAHRQQERALSAQDATERVGLLVRHETALQRIETLRAQVQTEERIHVRRLAELKARMSAVLLGEG
eukprot:m.69896 g.69896  ORF g.69896 m.69896 type:complete len:842 (+) comp7565_c0_seq1:36-2561(+)